MTHRCILLVADDEDQRVLFTHFLTSAGYGVNAVASGEAALAALVGAQYDLLCTDYQLPEMQGDDLIRSVRRQGFHGKIILMTNHVNGRQFARELQVDGYFDKIDFRRFLTTVKHLLADG